MSLSCYLLMVVNHLSVISAGTKLSPPPTKDWSTCSENSFHVFQPLFVIIMIVLLLYFFKMYMPH